MKLIRTVSGAGLLFSSAIWGRVIETITGYTEVWGWVAITSVIAFIGGIMFWSGVSD